MNEGIILTLCLLLHEQWTTVHGVALHPNQGLLVLLKQTMTGKPGENLGLFEAKQTTIASSETVIWHYAKYYCFWSYSHYGKNEAGAVCISLVNHCLCTCCCSHNELSGFKDFSLPKTDVITAPQPEENACWEVVILYNSFSFSSEPIILFLEKHNLFFFWGGK